MTVMTTVSIQHRAVVLAVALLSFASATFASAQTGPTCTLISTPDTIVAGAPFSISWTSANSTTATLDHGIDINSISGATVAAGTFSWAGGMPPDGLVTDEPYVMTVGDGVVTSTCTVRVAVIHPLYVSAVVVGGTAAVGDFSIAVTGAGNPSPSSFAASAATSTVFVDRSGAYSVAATGPAGYTPSYSAECAGTMGEIGSKSCVVTLTSDVPVDTGSGDGEATTTPATTTPPVIIVDVENTEALCQDGIDNDRDSFPDIADSDCAPFVRTLTAGGGSGGGSGGGNGPIFGGSFGPIGPTGGSSGSSGQVLGATTGPTATSSDALPAGCTAYLDTYLKRGSSHSDKIKKLQEFLNEELGLSLPVSGIFGSMTFEAVKAFQLKYKDQILTPWAAYGHDGTPTGYVYKTTLHQINLAKCKTLNEPAPQLP